MQPIERATYSELLRYARRVTRRADEAEDLLQTVLLAAVKAGRTNLSCAHNRRWLAGALRKRALFDARSAVRRKRREASVAVEADLGPQTDAGVASFVQALPPGLRATALLAVSGHTKAEICWLLRVSDVALRQRVAQIRKRWRDVNRAEIAEPEGLDGALAFGRIRRSLLASVRRDGTVLASHDPDGHLFVMTSQNGISRQQEAMSTREKE